MWFCLAIGAKKGPAYGFDLANTRRPIGGGFISQEYYHLGISILFAVYGHETYIDTSVEEESLPCDARSVFLFGRLFPCDPGVPREIRIGRPLLGKLGRPPGSTGALVELPDQP